MPGAAIADPPSGRRAARISAPAATTPSPTDVDRAAQPLVTPARWPDAGRRLLGVPLSVVLWLEVLTAAIAVAAVRRDALAVAAAALLVGGTALGVLVRPRGTPLHRLATTWWGYRRRVRRRPGPIDDPRLAAAATLLPRLHVESAPLRGDRRFGVAFDGDGWVAALELEPQPTLLSGGTWSRAVPLHRMAGLLKIDDIRLSSVQLLVHTTPTPVGWLDPAWLPNASYQRIRPVTVPALRQSWLVLRLDPARGEAAVEARGGGVQGAHRALKRAVGRALEVLDGAGVPARALDDAALREALAVNLLGTGPASDAATRAPDPDEPGLETWRAWLAQGTAQTAWWLAGWPAGREPVEHLVQLLQSVQVAFGVVSLALHPDDAGGPPAARVLVRAGARPDAAPAVAGALEAAATASGARLHRLDGRHGPGLCATLPLGGGTR